VVQPTSEWTFDSDATDTFSTLDGVLYGNAYVDPGYLYVDSDSDSMTTSEGSFPVNRTIEIVVKLESLTVFQFQNES
jgi:hypothetical protein